MNVESKFCSECGAPHEEGALFCGECGVKISNIKSHNEKKVLREETPETSPKFHIAARFSYRMGAMFIDWTLIGLVSLLLIVTIEEFMYVSDEIFFTLLIPIILMAWFYNAGMEASKFQTTFGKYLFGLKVTNSKGNQCTIKCTSIRFIGKLISLPLYGAGYLLIAFTERKQALHDKLANTLVIEGEIKVKFMKKLCQVYEKMIKGETK